jgi:hypothetical protein
MQTVTLQPGQELRVVCASSNSNTTRNNRRNNTARAEGPNPTSAAGNNVPPAEGPNPTNASGIAAFFKGITGGKRNKTRKAQAGGKRGPNGYMKFAKEMRPKILKENPSMRSNVVAVAKKIGEAWRALPESERKKY